MEAEKKVKQKLREFVANRPAMLRNAEEYPSVLQKMISMGT